MFRKLTLSTAGERVNWTRQNNCGRMDDQEAEKTKPRCWHFGHASSGGCIVPAAALSGHVHWGEGRIPQAHQSMTVYGLEGDRGTLSNESLQ